MTIVDKFRDFDPIEPAWSSWLLLYHYGYCLLNEGIIESATAQSISSALQDIKGMIEDTRELVAYIEKTGLFKIPGPVAINQEELDAVIYRHINNREDRE